SQVRLGRESAMKVLLDECVPRGFRASLSGDEHHIVTVPEAGSRVKQTERCSIWPKKALMFS
ncbi:MAG: hypothetical protein WA824_12575, partial [Candidatus Sulfotelmatobacter sp.]